MHNMFFISKFGSMFQRFGHPTCTIRLCDPPCHPTCPINVCDPCCHPTCSKSGRHPSFGSTFQRVGHPTCSIQVCDPFCHPTCSKFGRHPSLVPRFTGLVIQHVPSNFVIRFVIQHVPSKFVVHFVIQTCLHLLTRAFLFVPCSLGWRNSAISLCVP